MRKMKKMRKIVEALTLTGIICMSSLLAGCSSGIPGIHMGGKTGTSDKPQSVSMVLGVHELFPVISLNTDTIYSKIYDACYTYGDFSAIVVDGDPFVACKYDINKPDKRIDDAKRRQLAKNNAKQIMAHASSVSAKTPEIDTLSAITLSAEALQSASEESEKSMIIYDSGLSTTRLLNFSAQNLIEEPVDSIVEQLDEQHAIPNLDGINVIWTGLGQTCGNQTELTSDYKYKLKNIWERILTKSGAKTIDFNTSPLSAEEYAMDLPKCSTVPVVEKNLDVAKITSENELPDITIWDENSPLKFIKNESVFADEAAALEQMEPVAAYLTANPDERVYIFGMTATVNGGDLGIQLSEDRANACKEILINQGVRESQLVTAGLGQLANPLRVNDVGTDGVQIEEMAQKNRAVFVVKPDSAYADELMKCAGSV